MTIKYVNSEQRDPVNHWQLAQVFPLWKIVTLMSVLFFHLFIVFPKITLGNNHTNPQGKYAREHLQLSWGVGRCHCAAPLSLGQPPVTLNWVYYSCNHSVGIFLRMRSEPRAEI